MPDGDIRDLTLRVRVDGNQLKALGADFKNVGGEAKGASAQAQGFFRRTVTSAAKAAAGMVVLYNAYKAVRNLLVGSVRDAIDFESAFAKITGLVGVSLEQVALWKQELKDLAPTVGKGLGELADALFFISSAQFEGAEAVDVLTQSAKASTAGLGETQTIARLVTGAVTTYGRENLSAAEATDILTAAVREGKAEASDYAGSLGRVLAQAQNLHVEFSEVAGVIASASLLEVPVPEAVTQLRAVLRGLIKPGSEAKDILAQVAREGTGVALTFADIRREIRERGLYAGIELLGRAAEELGEEKFARLFESGEAFNLIVGLLGKNAAKTREILRSTADSSGSTDAAFKEAELTTKFWAEVLRSELGTAMVNFGTVVLPIVTLGIKALITFVSLLNDAFTGLYRTVKRVFDGISDSITGTLSRLDGFLRRLPRNAAPEALTDISLLVPEGAGAGVRGLTGITTAARERAKAEKETLKTAKETLETEKETLKTKAEIADATRRLNEINLDLLPDSTRIARARDEALEELDEIAAAIPERAEEVERARLAISTKYLEKITQAEQKELIARLKNSDSFYDRLEGQLIGFRHHVAQNDQLMANFFADTLSQMRNAFSDLFYNVITSKFDSLSGVARNTWSAILRSFTQLLAQMATQRLVLNIVPNLAGSAAAGGVQGASSRLLSAGGLGGVVSRIPGFGPGQIFGGPASPLGGVGPVQSTPFLASGAANLLGAGAGAYNVIGSLLGGNYAGAAGAGVGGAIGAGIASAIPGIGTLVGFGIGSSLGKLIGGFFRKKPKLDIDIEPSDRAVVEDLLAEGLAESISISSRQTGADRARIRAAVATALQGQISEVRGIIRSLPAQIGDTLNDALLQSAIDSEEHFGRDRLLEFDEKGKKIKEQLEKFLGGELQARFLFSVRDFFSGAFESLGVLPERARELVDVEFERFKSAGSREDRAAIGREFLALFASAADVYNLVNTNVLDPLAQQIRAAEEAAKQFGFEGIPSLEAVDEKLRELFRDFDDPEALRGLAEFRQGLVALRTELAGSLTSFASQIRATAGRITALGRSIGRDFSGRQEAALLANVESLDVVLQDAALSAQQRSAVLDEQHSNIQELISLERERFEQAKRAELATLDIQLAAIKKLRTDFTGVFAAAGDALLSLRTGSDSILSPAERLQTVRDEISQLQGRAATAQGADLVDIQQRLTQLFPEAVRIAREGFGEGSAAAFAQFAAAEEGLKLVQEQTRQEIVTQQGLAARQNEISAQIAAVQNRTFTVSVQTSKIIDAHLSDQISLQEEQLLSQSRMVSELEKIGGSLRRIESSLERSLRQPLTAGGR